MVQKDLITVTTSYSGETGTPTEGMSPYDSRGPARHNAVAADTLAFCSDLPFMASKFRISRIISLPPLPWYSQWIAFMKSLPSASQTTFLWVHI